MNGSNPKEHEVTALRDCPVNERLADAPIESPFRITHYPNSRFWAVYDGADLVVVTVYRRGAEEVRRRLHAVADVER